eukprot:5742381-Amphidinium_carterae.1
MAEKVRQHISSWVLTQQDLVDFTKKGSGERLYEIEVDEVTLAKMPSGDDRLPVLWISYLGIVRRGDPSSLKLVRLPLRKTKARAPGPGPITSRMWAPHAASLAGKNLIMHANSARAYKKKIEGV